MPKSNPDFLMKMLHNLESGKIVRGKSGNLEIGKSEDGMRVFVDHFGTRTLELDFYKEGAEKVVYQYGESQTDARYLNTVLMYFNLSHFFDIGYGNTNGWRFSLMKPVSGGEVLPIKEWIHDFNYKGEGSHANA
jgi:hypothetical protein